MNPCAAPEAASAAGVLRVEQLAVADLDRVAGAARKRRQEGREPCGEAGRIARLAAGQGRELEEQGPQPVAEPFHRGRHHRVAREGGVEEARDSPAADRVPARRAGTGRCRAARPSPGSGSRRGPARRGARSRRRGGARRRSCRSRRRAAAGAGRRRGARPARGSRRRGAPPRPGRPIPGRTTTRCPSGSHPEVAWPRLSPRVKSTPPRRAARTSAPNRSSCDVPRVPRPARGARA